MKWKEFNPIITDKRIPMRLKAKVYTIVVRPAMFGVWVRMLGAKEERSKKITNSRDEYATKDVGSVTA